MSALAAPGLSAIRDSLRCPICAGRLELTPGALRCRQRHTFNIARHGYVSLLSGTNAISGDDAPMIQARERFLATGAYEPIRRAVSTMVSHTIPRDGIVLDVGCGTGYYLAGALDKVTGARGQARRGGARQGMAGEAGRGGARLSGVRQGEARRGEAR